MAKPQEPPSFNGSVEHGRFKDIAELRGFMQSFIDLWDRDRRVPVELQVEYAYTSGPVIWSLANHSVELTRTILLLSEQDRLVVAVPLIRLLLENMITGAWLYLSPSGARALVHEGLRTRVAAIREVLQRGSAGFTPGLLEEWKGHLDEFEGDATAEGRIFEQRCLALVGGPGIYTTWRMASSLSHAGLSMSDFYLVAVEKSDQNPLGVALNRDNTLPSHEAWLGTAACALLGSMKTFDLISGRASFETQLADGARQMGIDVEFRLAGEDASTES